MVFWGFFNRFFNNILIYTAANNADYFKVVEAFKTNGLKYKVKNLSRHSSTPGQHFRSIDFRTPVFYEFYINKEDEHKAREILQNLKK